MILVSLKLPQSGQRSGCAAITIVPRIPNATFISRPQSPHLSVDMM
jgi:hypothetical protein